MWIDDRGTVGGKGLKEGERKRINTMPGSYWRGGIVWGVCLFVEHSDIWPIIPVTPEAEALQFKASLNTSCYL